MKCKSKIVRLVRAMCLFTGVVVLWVVSPEPGAAQEQLDVLLERTARQVSSFLDLISEMNCTERVLQEKLAEK